MKRTSWYIVIGVALIAVSVLGFAIQIAIFHRPADTFFYILEDLSFLPISVLLVTLVINELLQAREKSELGQKVNIVIAVFFVELGYDLLRYLSLFDIHLEEMREIAGVREHWSSREFSTMRRRLEQYDYSIDCHCADLKDLKRLLDDKRGVVIELLTNSSLLENVSFTQLLWAILHLSYELQLRPDLDHLPEADYAHLGDDMRRVYVQLVREWLSSVQRLKDRQPYSFSLAMRVNPFAEHTSPIIEGNDNPESDQ